MNAMGFICWTFDIYEVDIYLFNYLFGVLISLSTLYRSYHDG